ncbi:MAG: PAS domain S-box protein [Chloroflexi bacterium]|nr:PAS domain S-box protein [Chloroflexota bacterium]
MAATDNLTILNVDDDEIGLYTKTRILRRAGYIVLEAQTGREALRLVKEAQPQLVLLDVKLPDMSGLEVGRQIKTSLTTAQIMVLHISATYLDQGTRTRALEGGADAYISAPIEADELLANVNALLRLWRAEATIRESEERWALAVRTTGDAIWDWDLITGKMWWNEAYHQRFGQWPLDAQHSRQWWADHIHPDDRKRIVASFQTSIAANATAWSEEYRYQRADHTYAEILDRASIMRNAEGVATRVLGAILDLSERKQVERQLAYHAHLLKNMHDAVLATDANFRLTVWNQGAERMYGWKASEVLGQHVQSIILSESGDPQIAESLDGLKVSGRQRAELTTRHKDGALIYTESVTVALYDENEQITGYLSINRDISERKHYEQELKALNASLEQRVAERTVELEQSNQELDRFAYVASHDLRSPLRAIDNLASWITEDANEFLPEASKTHLTKLKGRVQRMEKLLEDLLAYSRAGRYQYPSEKWIALFWSTIFSNCSTRLGSSRSRCKSRCRYSARFGSRWSWCYAICSITRSNIIISRMVILLYPLRTATPLSNFVWPTMGRALRHNSTNASFRCFRPCNRVIWSKAAGWGWPSSKRPLKVTAAPFA